MKLNKSSEPGFHCLYVYAILLNHLYGLYLLCPRSFFSSVKISWRYFSKLPNLKICPAYQPPPKVEEREESEGERKILYRKQYKTTNSCFGSKSMGIKGPHHNISFNQSEILLTTY